MAKPMTELPKMHRVRFTEETLPAPGKYKKEHEVLQGDSSAAVLVTYTHSITIDKSDIEFLMDSEV